MSHFQRTTSVKPGDNIPNKGEETREETQEDKLAKKPKSLT